MNIPKLKKGGGDFVSKEKPNLRNDNETGTSINKL